MGERGLRHLKKSLGLNRDKIIRWLSGGEDFVCERKNLIVYALHNFKSV